MRDMTTSLRVDDPEVRVVLSQSPEPDTRNYDGRMNLTIEEAEDLYVKLGVEIIRAKAVAVALTVGK